MTIDNEDLAKGVLGLVMALLEIIRDLLARQALRRLESGTITESQAERLGDALMQLDRAIADIKDRHGIAEATDDVRRQLDTLARQTLDLFHSESLPGSEGGPS